MANTIDNRKAQNNDVYHYSGDVFDASWTITRDDDSAYDLSGETIVLSIKADRTDSVALETLTTTLSEISIGGASNNVLTFNKVVTLPEGAYYYDLEITSENYTISYGIWYETYDTNR
jgi:hypothetical protein